MPKQIRRGIWLFIIIAILFLLILSVWTALHVAEARDAFATAGMQTVETVTNGAVTDTETAPPTITEDVTETAIPTATSSTEDVTETAIPTATSSTVEEEEPGVFIGPEDTVEEGDTNDIVSDRLLWLGKFNEPPWQWIDWLLASLMGVLIYLLANIAYYYQMGYPRDSTKPNESDSDVQPAAAQPINEISSTAKFIEFTPWYISTIIKGPLIALAILVFFTNVSLEVSGLTVDFRELGADVLLVVAFILGFFSRVAREQLNSIVKSLFRGAYGRAEEPFTISPNRTKVELGGSAVFSISRPTEVTWHLDPDIGTIANGVYTAPMVVDSVMAGKKLQVQVTALPRDPNIPRATATIELQPPESNVTLIIDPSEAQEITPGGIIEFKVKPADIEVEWRANIGAIDASGKYTAPTENLDQTDEVTVKPIGRDDIRPAVTTVSIRKTE